MLEKKDYDTSTLGVFQVIFGRVHTIPSVISIAIKRYGFDITEWKLDEHNRCTRCGYQLPITGRLSSAVDEAREMGTQNGNNRVVEFILSYFRKFDLDSVLKIFRVIGAEYSNAYVYSESGDDSNRTIILRHMMGLTASAYYGASLKALWDRLGLKVELGESDDQVICKIRGVDKKQSLVQSRSTHG